jgi:ribonucleoside-diphosphate reductase alpha chain
MENLLQYFSGDTMAADTWQGKYQMKDEKGTPLEELPSNMHLRLAREFAKIEVSYLDIELKHLYTEVFSKLSPFGQQLLEKRADQGLENITEEILSYFDGFKHIVPQGSIMANLGNPYVIGSLSNCFVIASPEDSYGGILRADEELVQLMKRRGGVGTTLNYLRPTGAMVTNAARTSTGVPSFAERYSNSTREVGQDGRRGALMLLLHCAHPEIFKFVTMKEDRTKVTGANVSVMFTDQFMELVEQGATSFVCKFPIDTDLDVWNDAIVDMAEYNKLTHLVDGIYFMKINPQELFDTFVKMAHSNAEPGAAYIDRIQDYSPDGVYERYRPTKCNPCGEIWMPDYDACRLIAQLLLSIIKDPFTDVAQVDMEKLYEVSYMQQRYSDDLIDLEVAHIDRIIAKIKADPEDEETKAREIKLWEKIRSMTNDGRRSGNGFTGLGDMLAALGLRYDSDKAMIAIETVLKEKMRGELDATIDMALLRGPFVGWDRDLEFKYIGQYLTGQNSFFQMLCEESPEQALRMYEHGRRNVSWSTVAPTGTVSIMTQTTSGMEPLFAWGYFRKKKINPNDIGTRVDFVDQNGDKWQEYPVLHPQFKNWLALQGITMTEDLSPIEVELWFEKSPWHHSQADDISWQKRVQIQSIIQKYTTNAVSSTINLPKTVSEETVRGIYLEAWKRGLKGVTVYRDGSRTGVLVKESVNQVTNEFGYVDAIKRPHELPAEYFFTKYKGKKYAVVVGLLNEKPYEVFAFENPIVEHDLEGVIIKVASRQYKFVSNHYTIENLQLPSEHSDERLLTRWASLSLRHGTHPKYIVEQVEKSEVTVAAFGKVVARILKKYIPNEELGEECPECKEHAMAREEGCKKCRSCGYSKC